MFQHDANWDRASKLFFDRLIVGEFIQFCWIHAVTQSAPHVPICSFGNVPSNQIVWDGWNRQGIHAQKAKPILYVGNDLLTLPDAMMVVDGVQYGAEVKTKKLNPNYLNVIINLKEVSELQEAAGNLCVEPVFVFHIRDEETADPSTYVGDMEKLPPLKSYYVATLDVLDSLNEVMTCGERSFRIPFDRLTPASVWLGCEDDQK